MGLGLEVPSTYPRAGACCDATPRSELGRLRCSAYSARMTTEPVLTDSLALWVSHVVLEEETWPGVVRVHRHTAVVSEAVWPQPQSATQLYTFCSNSCNC